MKFSVQQTVLLTPLVNLLRNSGKTPFECIQLEAVASDRIRLTTQNGVITLEYVLPVLNAEGNTVMVNAKEFTEIVNKLNGLINFDNGTLTCNKKKVKIGIKSEVIYQTQVTPENSIILDFTEFKNVIKNRVFACQEGNVGVMNSLCLNNNEICATNGTVLSLGKLKQETGFENLLISQNLAKEIISCFESEKVNIAVDGNKIILWDDVVKMSGMTVNGQYPRYQQLIPEHNPKYVNVEKNKLIENLDLMGIVADNKNPIVKLTFDSNVLTLQSAFQESDAIAEMEVDYNFEPITIAFNINYLIAVLRNCNSDIVSVEMNTPLSATLIKTADEKNLIMPIQLKG